MPRKSTEPIKRTSVWLTKAQLAHLERITRETGIPGAVLIRRGVDWAIEQHAAPPSKHRKRSQRR